MVETIQAKDVTLKQLKTLVNLQLVNDNQFFHEWQENLPEISELQQQLLDDVKAGYFNLLYYPPLLEKTVNLAILSPLLFIGKFYLEPFHIKAEKTVEISVDDHGMIVKGSIDTLVLHNEFWMTIIESKQASFSIEAGLPQILAYMLANPNPDQPSYGMITTGGTFIFIKLVNSEKPRYATSAEFSLRNPGNDLYQVLRILKKLTQIDI